MAGEIIFLEYYQTSGSQVLCQVAHNGSRVGQMHENQPADDRIVFVIQRQAENIPFLEGDLVQTSLLNARACQATIPSP